MFEIRVPATSANMGPGFDALGIAFKLYNTFTFEEIESGVEIFGCDKEFCNEKNLVYEVMVKIFAKLNVKLKGIRITFDSNIPLSGGLGSSATCILAGIVAANKLCGNKLSKKEVLEFACEIEGHPDNITPAYYGGMTTAIMEENRVIFNDINIDKDIKFCALIPKLQLSTKKSRAVLPSEIPFKDAVYNVGRVALMISSLIKGNEDGIKAGCKDILHQQYRGALIENYDEIINFVENSTALGCFLSGAGPTIMTMYKNDDNAFTSEIKGFLDKLTVQWSAIFLEVDREGLIVTDK